MNRFFIIFIFLMVSASVFFQNCGTHVGDLTPQDSDSTLLDQLFKTQLKVIEANENGIPGYTLDLDLKELPDGMNVVWQDTLSETGPRAFISQDQLFIPQSQISSDLLGYLAPVLTLVNQVESYSFGAEPYFVNFTSNSTPGSRIDPELSTPELKIHYSFEEAQGVVPKDGTNLSSASFTSSPTKIPSELETALNFDGIDDYLNIYSFNLNPSKFSFSVFFKPSEINENILLMSAQNSQGNALLEVEFVKNSREGHSLSYKLHSNGSSYQFISAKHSMTNQWQHLALVFDGQYLISYINAREAGRLSIPVSMPFSNFSNLYLAGSPSHQNLFKGGIDDLRFYDKALTQLDVIYMAINCVICDAELPPIPIDENPAATDVIAQNFGYKRWITPFRSVNKVFDLSGSTWTLNNSSYDLDSNPNRTCESNGGPLTVEKYPLQIRYSPYSTLLRPLVDGEVNLNVEWDRAKCNSAGIFINWDSHHTAIIGARVDSTVDGLKNGGTNSSHFNVVDSWFSNSIGDCIENDDYSSGVIKDSLLENCSVALSIRESNGGNDFGENNVEDFRTITLENILVKLKAFNRSDGDGPDYRSGPLIKSHNNSPSMRVINSVFAFDNANSDGAQSNIERVMGPNTSKLKECRGNKVLWLSDDPQPSWLSAFDPGCFEIINGQEAINYWQQARCDWLEAHPPTVTRRHEGDPNICP